MKWCRLSDYADHTIEEPFSVEAPGTTRPAPALNVIDITPLLARRGQTAEVARPRSQAWLAAAILIVAGSGLAAWARETQLAGILAVIAVLLLNLVLVKNSGAARDRQGPERQARLYETMVVKIAPRADRR